MLSSSDCRRARTSRAALASVRAVRRVDSPPIEAEMAAKSLVHESRAVELTEDNALVVASHVGALAQSGASVQLHVKVSL